MNLTSSVLAGDALAVLRTLPAESAQCCVTPPPYWGLRDYGVDGQIGLEQTPQEFIARLVAVFDEVRRVLKPDGVLWCNMGDSYAAGRGGGDPFSGFNLRWSGTGSKGKQDQMHGAFPESMSRVAGGLKPKDLCGMPWRLAFALQDAGWRLRSDCIWHKPNPMPESVTDRPTKAHDYVFLLTKGAHYFYDVDATRTPQKTLGERHEGMSGYRAQHPSKGGIRKRSLHPLGANMRTVWTIASQPRKDAHFAMFPDALAARCILAGSRAGDTVLDPFTGGGTTGVVAARLGRSFVGSELNPEYAALARRRIGEAHLERMGAL